MDRILITNLRATTVIGVLPHERETPQPLQIDVSIGADLGDAGRTDELSDTVDYGLVASKIADLASSASFILLERFAAAVADIVLGFDRVTEVDVTVTKLRPPVGTMVDSTAVRMIRRRSDVAVPVGDGQAHEAIVALGSNLGDREEYLRAAVHGLAPVVAMSDVYETEPIGGPDAQPAYLNMVAVVATTLDPYAFLRRCQRIESEAQRRREIHWGPRTLDIDLLFYDDAQISSDELTVPHPRIGERRFVLQPLNDVAPERCPADWETTLPPAVVESRGRLQL